MTLGVLGDIVFEVSSDYIRTISDMQIEHTYKYAEHEIVKGKSRLQYLGKQLDKIVIKGVFADYFCNPEEEIKKLKQQADKEEPLVFVVGDAIFGEFVIEKIRQIIGDVDSEGKIRRVEFEVELKEYY